MNIFKRTLAATGTLVLTATLGVVLPVLGAPPATAEDAICGFSGSNNANAAIPDNGSLTSTTDLTAQDFDDPIVDLDVIINIDHTFVGDIEVSLSSRGETVLLTSRNGFGGDDYTFTHFNDGATTKISDGSAPFTGHFRPERSLNAFDDLNLSGVWTLTVSDKVSSDTGTLVSWFLVSHTKWCDDGDRDTVKQDYDLCPDVKGVQPHGCPVRARTLTISYNNAEDEFRGVLRCTSASRCANNQPVRIYKVQAGRDALIGRDFTNGTGNYVLPKANVNGTYYAVAPRVVEELVAECKRAQSANRTV